MQVRSLGFATDLAIRRLAGSEIVHGPAHLVVRTPANPDYWWGNFVLVDGPDAVGEGMATFAASFPGAAHVAIGVDGTDGAVGTAASRLGLQADVSVVMVATSHAVAAPAPALSAVHTRELQSDADWKELLSSRMAEAEVDGPPAALDPAFQLGRVDEARELVSAGRAVFVGAFFGEHLVSSLGVVSDGSGRARYQHVHTDPRHRRRGLAGWLLLAAARRARDRWSAGEVVIVADPAGPAIDLYRSVGFREVEKQVQLQRSSGDPQE